MHILVTAGPTREFFDTVRFVSNPSSGKMGFAIASAASSRGHQVSLVAGPVALADPRGVDTLRVVSAAEMYEASCFAFETCDAAIMTAAVCDYRPARKLDHKLKKQARTRTIKLLPTTDIAASLGAIKGSRVLIGFAMEDHDHHAHAEQKLARKNCDAIVLNGPENVGGNEASIEILRAGGTWSRPVVGLKTDLAEFVVQLAEELSALRRS